MSSESEYMPPLRGLRVAKIDGEFFVAHHALDRTEDILTIGLSPKTFDAALSMIGVLESHPIFQHVDWKEDEDGLKGALTLSNLHAIKELDRAYAKAEGGATP